MFRWKATAAAPTVPGRLLVDDELLLDAPVTVGIAPEDADPDELIGRAGASVVDVPLAFEWTIQA